MKALIAAGMLALLASGNAIGQTGQTGQTGSSDTGTRTAAPAKSMQTQRLYRSSKIIGSTVRDLRDKKIGEIKDLLLDSGRGEIAYAVVNFGGVMGVGAKYHAVPWQALQPSDDGKYFVLNADRETISLAPSFDRGNWPDMADQHWTSDVDRYWARMVGRGSSGTNRLPAGSSGAPSSR